MNLLQSDTKFKYLYIKIEAINPFIHIVEKWPNLP